MRGQVRVIGIVLCVVCVATPAAWGQARRAGWWFTWGAEVASWWTEVWGDVSLWSPGTVGMTGQAVASSTPDPAAGHDAGFGTVTTQRSGAPDPDG